MRQSDIGIAAVLELSARLLFGYRAEQVRIYTSLRDVCVLPAARNSIGKQSGRASRQNNEMSIFHLSAQIIGRSSGRSSTAAAAYRAAYRIVDVRTGEVHNFTRKGGVRESFILTPDSAPTWMRNRAALWNSVEQVEKRKDAQLAREVELSVPHELPHELRRALLVEFVHDEFVSRGMIADVAMHEPTKHGDRRNEHAHILLTLRHIDGDGFGKKAREWNDAELVEHWRASWARRVNEALEKDAIASKVDHRSYARQALASGDDVAMANLPTVHLGPQASAMERRGTCTLPGDLNREVRIANLELESLRPQLSGNAQAPQNPKQILLPRLFRRGPAQQREQLQQDLRSALDLPGMQTAQEAHAAIGQQRDKISAIGKHKIDKDETLRSVTRRLETADIAAQKLRGQRQALQAQDKSLRTQKSQNLRTLEWRKTHPFTARLHDLGLFPNAAASWDVDPIEWQRKWDTAKAEYERVKEKLLAAEELWKAASHDREQIMGRLKREVSQELQKRTQHLECLETWVNDLARLEAELLTPEEEETHLDSSVTATEENEDGSHLSYRP